MSDLINSVPECPESITTADERDLFAYLCSQAIHERRLTGRLLESITDYVFIVQIANALEEELLKDSGNPFLNNLMHTLVTRCLEHSEAIGLTPLDRINLGL